MTGGRARRLEVKQSNQDYVAWPLEDRLLGGEVVDLLREQRSRNNLNNEVLSSLDIL